MKQMTQRKNSTIVGRIIDALDHCAAQLTAAMQTSYQDNDATGMSLATKVLGGLLPVRQLVAGAPRLTTEAVAVDAPKRRGRPRMVRTDIVVTSNALSDTPKKRGRPRKNPLDASAPRVGRPRKNAVHGHPKVTLTPEERDRRKRVKAAADAGEYTNVAVYRPYLLRAIRGIGQQGADYSTICDKAYNLVRTILKPGDSELIAKTDRPRWKWQMSTLRRHLLADGVIAMLPSGEGEAKYVITDIGIAEIEASKASAAA